jgi:hypothetical protein
MKVLKYLLVGFVFESYWQNRKQFGNRIYEMFQFQSFHMYGIIMVAIGTGWLEPDYKRKKITDIKGTPIEIPDKEMAYIVTGLVG